MSVFGAFKYAGDGMFTISESDLVEVMECLLKWNVGDSADLFREDNFWYTAESFGYNEAEDIEEDAQRTVANLKAETETE